MNKRYPSYRGGFSIVRLSRSMIIEARTGAILPSYPLRGLYYVFFTAVLVTEYHRSYLQIITPYGLRSDTVDDTARREQRLNLQMEQGIDAIGVTCKRSTGGGYIPTE